MWTSRFCSTRTIVEDTHSRICQLISNLFYSVCFISYDVKLTQCVDVPNTCMGTNCNLGVKFKHRESMKPTRWRAVLGKALGGCWQMLGQSMTGMHRKVMQVSHLCSLRQHSAQPGHIMDVRARKVRDSGDTLANPPDDIVWGRFLNKWDKETYQDCGRAQR